MFRISRVRHPATHVSSTGGDGDFDGDTLRKYCATDEWNGDLSNGLFRLGKLSEQLHGLLSPECGLLTLLRCYEDGDRVRILELLEGASFSAASFCFSTQIVAGPSGGQPLICIGHSTGFDDGHAGLMHGIFIFPRMPAEVVGH